MTSPAPTRPLPARAVPLPGESLTSLVRRTSQAMGYDNPRQLVALLATQGPLPSHLNEVMPGRVLDYLSVLLRQHNEALSSLTVHRFAPSLLLVPKKQRTPGVCDSKTPQRYFAPSRSICPQCLKQDAIPYERLLWSFRPIPVCTTHGCLFVSRCPACNRPLRWDRPDASRCACGALLSETDPVSVSSHGTGLVEKLYEMLLGQFMPSSEMSPAASFWWARCLAAAAGKTPAWLADVAKRLEIETSTGLDATEWLAAAEILVSELGPRSVAIGAATLVLKEALADSRLFPVIGAPDKA